jgi:hypothetical protein
MKFQLKITPRVEEEGKKETSIHSWKRRSFPKEEINFTVQNRMNALRGPIFSHYFPFKY